MNALDAVALAIMRFEGNNLANRNLRNVNPGNLRASELAQGKDGDGYCYFMNFLRGYLALLKDIHDKFTGMNFHGLNQDSTLIEMMSVYAPFSDNNMPVKYAEFVANFIMPVKPLEMGMHSKLSDIWTPKDGTPWDSQLSQYLSR